MMKKWILIGIACMFPPICFAQFNGGPGDGVGLDVLSAWLDGISTFQLYQGGIADGQDNTLLSSFLNGQDLHGLYTGGTSDGQDSKLLQSLLDGQSLDILFTGGEGDGVDLDLVQSFLSGEDLSFMFEGGAGDGHDVASTEGFAVPFPIALLSFDAFPYEEFVLIQWITESEVNLDFFMVERSQNARDFIPLVEVAGGGGPNQMHTYETTDTEPLNGRSYYRLKSTDLDGSFSFSHIVEVQYEAPKNWQLLVYPNPNPGTELNVRLSGIAAAQNYLLEMLDMQGRIVYQKELHSQSYILETQVPFGHSLTKGSYLIRISSASGQLSKLLLVR